MEILESHIPIQPETIRDREYQQLIAEKLAEIRAIRQENSFLAYASHKHLFAELQQIYKRNLEAYQADYLPNQKWYDSLQKRLSENEAIHPVRRRKAETLLQGIAEKLEVESYLTNREAEPLLTELSQYLDQAELEIQQWEKSLGDWRMHLKELMVKVWAEDYADLKQDYQLQKELLQGQTMPRSPLAAHNTQVETAIAKRESVQKRLKKRLALHPRLKRKAQQELFDQYISLEDFEVKAKGLRRKASSRKAIGSILILGLVAAIGAGAWFGPQWYNAKQDLQAWQTAVSANSLQAYEQYLQDFPQGQFADSANEARMQIPSGRLENMVSRAGEAFEYEGALRNALPHGRGIALYSDSSWYDGYWKDGYRDSTGTWRWADGSTYTGDFQMDRPHGKGDLQYANGDLYQGNWKNGKYHGWGAFKGQNGREYRGGWQTGQPQGKGKYAYADGSTYDGYWQDGLYHGTGRFTEKSGLSYMGNWQQNKKHGEGQLTWPNGARFSGSWVNDTIRGNGIFVTRFRDELSGYWEGLPHNVSFRDGAGNLLKQGRWEDGLFLE